MSVMGQHGSSRVAGRTIVTDALGGMVAGVVMAMYAMLASATFLRQGFFTPLYGIAAPIVGQSAMAASMKQGIYFALAPALAGLLIHMMWSALYGIGYGLIFRLAHLRGTSALAVGAAYGLAIELVMSLIVLPLVGLGTMAGMIGLPSFTVEHLLFGLTLGVWFAARLRPASASTTTRVSMGS